jgi:two-component system cell cycle sensor histidine kinase/response regulator CckA
VSVLARLRKLTAPRASSGRERTSRPERALDPARGLLRALEVNAVAEALGLIVAYDRRGVISYLSPSFERVIGIPLAEAIGRSVFDFVCPDDLEQVRAIFEHPAERSLVFRIRHRDGHDSTVQALAHIASGEGRERTFVSVLSEVDAHLRTEQALRASVAALNAVVASAPLGIVVVDRSARVQVWNAEADRILGVSGEQMEGRLLSTDDSPVRGIAVLLERALAGERVRSSELECTLAGGRQLSLSVSVAPLELESGERSGAVAVIEDISDRRELEQRYQQSQKLEAVGRLAGGLAHDLNNVLTVISGYASSLEQEQGGVGERAALIREAAARAASLTRELLTFSRSRRMQMETLSLSATVADMRAMIERMVPEDVELVFNLDPAAGWIEGDRGQIEQLLLNLIVNSCDALSDGGRITIETASELLTEDNPLALPAGGYSLLIVSDTGVGMDEEVLAKIFDPFFTTKPPGQGTGLGLAMAYGTVDQHGGKIEVLSSPGAGTTVLSYFPLAAAPPRPRAPAERPDGRGEQERSRRTGTVLLAEDDDLVRQLVAEMLGELGFDVLAAANGREALELASGREQELDLLISDLVMPVMDGRRLAEQLRRIRGELPVLFVSGYDVRLRKVETAGEEPSAQNTLFLDKPFSQAEMASAIDRLVDR